MTEILVTGAAGFIGFALAKALSEDQENNIYCVDNFIRGEDDAAYRMLCERTNVQRLDLDLTVEEDVAQLPTQIDLVYHMAALNGTQNFYERPYEVVKACTLPTLFLLEKYRNTNLRRFVFAGTSEAYASTVTHFNWDVPTSEKVPLSISDPGNARWSYGGSKIHGEIAVNCAQKQYDLPFTIIRYHNVYGPRMGDKHVVPDFLTRARQGEFSLFGYEDTRAFMYIDDAISATIEVSNSPNCKNQTINIGAESEIMIRDLAETVMAIAGFSGEIELHPSPEGSVKRRAPDTRKLRALVNFQEKWSLADGLRETIDYYIPRKESLDNQEV